MYSGNSVRFRFLTAVVLGMFTQIGWSSATYYVDCNRPDDSGAGTSWASAKQTIQAGVDLAAAGSLVLVTNGVYNKGGKAETAGSTLTNRVYSPLNITIRAMSSNPADTVIVGAPDPTTGSNGPAAIRGYKGVCYGGTCYLIGFTITNGYTFDSGGTAYKDQYGGGAWGGILSNCVIVGNMAKNTGGGRAYGPTYNSILRNNTAVSGGGGGPSVNFYNCVISNNTATGSGGGFYQCNAFDCEIVNNTAGSGGALTVQCIASNCVIRGNSATSYGSVAGYSSATWHKFYNCLIAENVAPYGAIYQRYTVGSEGSRGFLINCTVVSNRATTSGKCAGLVGLSGGSGIYSVTNCIIRFNYNTADGVESNYNFTTNSLVAYSLTSPDVAGQPFDGGNNIAGDPNFRDLAGQDYHLRKGSSCVDSGMTIAFTNDLDRVLRPQDGNNDGNAVYDMGCYEYIWEAPGGAMIIMH